jgi:hypothetical protein
MDFLSIYIIQLHQAMKEAQEFLIHFVAGGRGNEDTAMEPMNHSLLLCNESMFSSWSSGVKYCLSGHECCV